MLCAAQPLHDVQLGAVDSVHVAVQGRARSLQRLRADGPEGVPDGLHRRRQREDDGADQQAREASVQLEGGNAAWISQGRAGEQGFPPVLAPRIDRYRRPYAGTNAPREAMQAYVDWEFGFVAQPARDGTHHFRVLKPAPAERSSVGGSPAPRRVGTGS